MAAAYGIGEDDLELYGKYQAKITDELWEEVKDRKDGKLVLAYNGEVYNFQQLREELIAAGRTFLTNSDSEVILQGYQQFGPEFTKRLRGMFAWGTKAVSQRPYILLFAKESLVSALRGPRPAFRRPGRWMQAGGIHFRR